METSFEAATKRFQKSVLISETIPRLLSSLPISASKIDIFEIARQFRVRVEFARVIAAQVDLRERVVWIPTQASAIDQRFLLAHELAHLLLAEDRLQQSAASSKHHLRNLQSKVRYIEMICDILARNLLLPESLLSGRQHRRASQIDFILSIAETAQVSVKNVFLRLAELRKIGTQRSVILLRTANNETARNAWHIVARKCSGRLPRGPFKPGKDLMLNGLNLPAGPQMHESKQWRVCIDLAQRSWNLQLEFSESSPEWLLLFLEPAEQLYLFDF